MNTALRLARFGRALRAQGVGVTLRDELDGAQALSLVDGADRDEARRALRIALKIAREDADTFDRLFGVFWSGDEPAAPPAPRPRASQDRPGGRLLQWNPQAGRMGGASSQGDEPGASPEALLRRKPFDESWSARDLAAMERLLARLARRLATRRSRRLVPTRGRGRADIRASYRRALRTSGELLTLARRARAIEQPRITFLLDTSGSMDAHSRFLLTFVLALRRAVRHAEAFAFNTELVRVTGSLARGKTRLTLDRLARAVPDWSGGTRIGDCLAAFVAGHFRREPRGRTAVVILSDGLERGDPSQLADAVLAIRRRARTLVWLNPLAGDPRYEPAAAGMRAALPFVDHFASAHDLQSLERLLPHLVA
jgi:uncharacterized protein with von Willebrand factor type A (vWA) domain